MRFRNVFSTAADAWQRAYCALEQTPTFATAEVACRASSGVWVAYHSEWLKPSAEDGAFEQFGWELASNFEVSVNKIASLPTDSLSPDQLRSLIGFRENIADRAKLIHILLTEGAETLEEKLVAGVI
jgi:hypothetical protein